MKFVRIIDKNGMFVEDAFVEKLTSNTIETPCQDGFYKPKWNGVEWVEGMAQEEINALNNQPSLPTQEERIDMLENMILMMMEV